MPRQETIAAIRFGYGLSPLAQPPDGPAALIAELDSADSDDHGLGGPSMAERAVLARRLRDARRSGDEDALADRRADVRALVVADSTAIVRRAATSRRGFVERWARFWADHFTVAARGPQLRIAVGRFEADAIRPHLTGRFADLLAAAATHPAMLLYLDQAQSFGPSSPAGLRTGRGLNENFARELLELHTVGADGGYAQSDVRELAELLTGLAIDRDAGAFAFRRRRAEPGAETVLGSTYGGDPARLEHVLAFFDDIAVRPETARHIGRRIARRFVADDPSPELIAHLAARWTDTGGDLRAVASALVEHPEAWERFGAKAKTPLDLIASGVRAAGAPEAAFALRDGDRPNPLTLGALRQMNHAPFSAPAPDGFPEEAEAWITPQGLAARLRWAGRAGRRIARASDPRAFLDVALADAARPETRSLVAGAAERWEGVALTLAAPEFNRR